MRMNYHFMHVIYKDVFQVFIFWDYKKARVSIICVSIKYACDSLLNFYYLKKKNT